MGPNTNKDQSRALETAWQHFAEYDYNANIANRQHLSLRGWVIVLAVVATLLALVVDAYPKIVENPGMVRNAIEQVLKVSLILVPIIGSAILAFANKLQQGESWLALRSGAEEILKEIYMYRTVLQGNERRHLWLNERLKDIQSRVFENVGGELEHRGGSA